MSWSLQNGWISFVSQQPLLQKPNQPCVETVRYVFVFKRRFLGVGQSIGHFPGTLLTHTQNHLLGGGQGQQEAREREAVVSTLTAQLWAGVTRTESRRLRLLHRKCVLSCFWICYSVPLTIPYLWVVISNLLFWPDPWENNPSWLALVLWLFDFLSGDHKPVDESAIIRYIYISCIHYQWGRTIVPTSKIMSLAKWRSCRFMQHVFFCHCSGLAADAASVGIPWL